MNYAFVSKLYNLTIDNDDNCENNHLIEFSASDYKSLENVLVNHDYDFIPNNITIDIKRSNCKQVEEALATPGNLILVSDGKKIQYNKTIFLIRWFCNNNAIIEIIDDKKYCEDCYNIDNNQLPVAQIKEILNSNDKTAGLSTSKKIQYLLVQHKNKKFTSKEIYNLFKENKWLVSGKTPLNTIASRCSMLWQKGIIHKEGVKYYIN